FLGYVVHWGGKVIYHSGDTLLHDALVPALRQFTIDFALLPINGDRPERRVAGNLDGRQAAQLAWEIRARCVIPCHFDMFEFNTRLSRRLRCRVRPPGATVPDSSPRPGGQNVVFALP